MVWMQLFFRQCGVLFWKNWIVLSKHPILNLLRCFIIPIAYGVFLAVAQIFLTKPNNFGLGSPAPLVPLQHQFDGTLSLIWADATGGSTFPSADDIMARVTAGFSPIQQNRVKKVDSSDRFAAECPQNFNLFSECFAAVSFNALPATLNSTQTVNYTILADGGLVHIDVVHHSSDFELRIFPVQWAIDEAIIFLRSGEEVNAPLEWPFTQETDAEQSTDIRLQYVRGLRSLLVLALFICYVGVAYQLPGAFMDERANLLTAHLKAMGLMDSARIISWHISITLAYLPAWIIVALIWHFRIFSGTNVGTVLAVHLLLGLSLESWSFFVASFFGKSPQLAAVCTTFLAVLLAILAQAFGQASSTAATIYSLIFPPGFYIFAIRAMAGFEVHQIPTNILHADPDNHLRILPLIVVAIIDTIIWPFLAVWLEHLLYDAKEPSTSTSHRRFWRHPPPPMQDSIDVQTGPGVAVSMKHLHKVFNTSKFRTRDKDVVAISDLSLDIPKFGISVLLGSNGAGKSTALSIIGGLLGRTNGIIAFEGGHKRPPRGTLGIVPQKNVLFPQLTCKQTLRVWSAIKLPADALADTETDIEQLLKDCDLGRKIDAVAATLSGGQKRKLQLAIGLIGGSSLVLVDECSSGVDPLSRRALWRTLISVRREKTILLTTHFLDEADLLADNIAILASPGMLVAQGSPVSLKSNLGEGYAVILTTSPSEEEKFSGTPRPEILEGIRAIAPETYISVTSPTIAEYHLKSKDSTVVEQVLQLLDQARTSWNVKSYTIHSSSMEDIFLSLMAEHQQSGLDASHEENESQSALAPIKALASGGSQKQSTFVQAITVFRKRVVIARRSWLTPALAVVIPIAGACIPLFFMKHRTAECTAGLTEINTTVVPLYLPLSPFGNPITTLFGGAALLTSPPNIASSLGSTTMDLAIDNISDNMTFIETVNSQFRNLTLGGISIDLSGSSLFAWEATPPGVLGASMLNFVDNIIYNNALNVSGKTGGPISLISPQYQSFPAIASGSLIALKWIAFYGATMAAFPAFFSLYASKERHSSVQAMMKSNGLANTAALWLGHLLFDSLLGLLVATVITIIFATTSQQFRGLGLFWIILVQYGVVGALFAYVVTLFTPSPLAAFAVVAGYQVLSFILYVAGYLLTYTYAKTSSAPAIITTIHFTLSLLSPVASVLRAAFVSINQFSLLCDEGGAVTLVSMGAILKFGGPILYLFGYGFALFAVLLWHDSGSIIPRRKMVTGRSPPVSLSHSGPIAGTDVLDGMKQVESSQDFLRILHVSKKFAGSKAKAVDDVSFGVSQETVFALLGPNGAGKTTLFNLIRGDISPDEGDILLKDVSVIAHPKTARLSLGVCPQFTAIDSQLTVKEHLMFYGRLKGMKTELDADVAALMSATGLVAYSNRLASRLSGGNQRKLSLAIALIGNPSIILIDEFSTGVDARMKREMWRTLEKLTTGKAVVITTHSMEEASALANRVGIVAGTLLALGTPESLAARYATYEVHLSCRTPEDVVRAQQLMARIPGAQMADDVATRFEVPVEREGDTIANDLSGRLTLAQLFKTLSMDGNFSEYAVERVSLETVFLKVIRENNVKEEDHSRHRHWWSFA